MDQGLKERLIGAAVLVALGVWLIPWVLDGKKEQVELDGSDAALRLPTPEEALPVRSQTLSLDEPEPFASEPDSAQAVAAAATPSAQPPANDDPPPASPAHDEPVIARADVAAPAASEPPAVVPPKQTVAPQSVAAAAPPARAPPARTDAKGDWVVQLGSFGEQENAKRLAQRVNTYGYKPEVSNHRSSGRAMYRVRVGPYATHAQADATASALSAHGFPAQVVAAD
jgi:DedD protein